MSDRTLLGGSRLPCRGQVAPQRALRNSVRQGGVGCQAGELSAIGYRLSAVGYRLSAIGCRLSAIGYRLSAIGYRLSAVSYQLMANG
jgi:hypothetical protein